MAAPTKGDKGTILRGDSSVGNAEVARGLLDDIVLPKDLAKYSATIMSDLTNHQEELLYEVKTSLTFFHHILLFLTLLD